MKISPASVSLFSNKRSAFGLLTNVLKEFRQTSVKKLLQFKVTDVASMFPVAFLSIERKAEALYIKDFRLFLGGWRVGLEPTTFRTTI